MLHTDPEDAHTIARTHYLDTCIFDSWSLLVILSFINPFRDIMKASIGMLMPNVIMTQNEKLTMPFSQFFGKGWSFTGVFLFTVLASNPNIETGSAMFGKFRACTSAPVVLYMPERSGCCKQSSA